MWAPPQVACSATTTATSTPTAATAWRQRGRGCPCPACSRARRSLQWRAARSCGRCVRRSQRRLMPVAAAARAGCPSVTGRPRRLSTATWSPRRWRTAAATTATWMRTLAWTPPAGTLQMRYHYTAACSLLMSLHLGHVLIHPNVCYSIRLFHACTHPIRLTTGGIQVNTLNNRQRI